MLPGSVFTQDLQASLAFVQRAFAAPPDRSPVTIDIRPQTSFPDPGTMHLATNVYCVTASEPVVAGRELLVTLEYSNQLPAPSDVYTYQGSGPWQRIGQTGSAVPYSISARTASLGCFAGGYVTGSAQGPRLGGGQTLPIVVALAILIVVLAGIPLAVLRRRDAGGDADPEEQ